MDDGELMRRLATGDGPAMRQLYSRFSRLVYSMIGRYAPGVAAAEAEELSQEVFMTLLSTAPRYQEQGRLVAWVCGISIRKARAYRHRNFLRRTLFSGYAADTRVEAASGADATFGERAHARLALDRAIRTLPEPQREVLLLHLVDRLEGAEIAQILGIKEKTVWTRLHRARLGLRRALGEPAAGEPEGDTDAV